MVIIREIGRKLKNPYIYYLGEAYYAVEENYTEDTPFPHHQREVEDVLTQQLCFNDMYPLMNWCGCYFENEFVKIVRRDYILKEYKNINNYIKMRMKNKIKDMEKYDKIGAFTDAMYKRDERVDRIRQINDDVIGMIISYV